MSDYRRPKPGSLAWRMMRYPAGSADRNTDRRLPRAAAMLRPLDPSPPPPPQWVSRSREEVECREFGQLDRERYPRCTVCSAIMSRSIFSGRRFTDADHCGATDTAVLAALAELVRPWKRFGGCDSHGLGVVFWELWPAVSIPAGDPWRGPRKTDLGWAPQHIVGRSLFRLQERGLVVSFLDVVPGTKHKRWHAAGIVGLTGAGRREVADLGLRFAAGELGGGLPGWTATAPSTDEAGEGVKP